MPTWKNRSGDTIVAKWLDHSLVVDSLLASFENIRSWIGMDTCSDHHPI